MAFLFGHLLAACAILVAPLLSYRRVRRPRHLAIPDKTSLYRRTVFMQAAAVTGLWLIGGVPAASLGLRAPRSWWMGASVGGAFISYFVYVGICQRLKAEKLRERMRGRSGPRLLPDTPRELIWFAVVCVLSGMAEESVYRGFLFGYISRYLPHINGPGLVVLTSLVFGIGHAYQGWHGIAATGVSGLIFGTLYVTSGSLLLPAVVHSTGNLQALLDPLAPPRC